MRRLTNSCQTSGLNLACSLTKAQRAFGGWEALWATSTSQKLLVSSRASLQSSTQETPSLLVLIRPSLKSKSSSRMTTATTPPRPSFSTAWTLSVVYWRNPNTLGPRTSPRTLSVMSIALTHKMAVTRSASCLNFESSPNFEMVCRRPSFEPSKISPAMDPTVHSTSTKTNSFASSVVLNSMPPRSLSSGTSQGSVQSTAGITTSTTTACTFARSHQSTSFRAIFSCNEA